MLYQPLWSLAIDQLAPAPMTPSRAGNFFYTNEYLKPSFTFISLNTWQWFRKSTARNWKATGVNDGVFNHAESFRNRTRKSEWQVSVGPRVVATEGWQAKEINRKTSEVVTVPTKKYYRHKCQVTQTTLTGKTITLSSIKNSGFWWKKWQSSLLASHNWMANSRIR